MWCLVVTPYVFTAGMITNALHQAKTLTTGTMTQATTIWTTYKAYAGRVTHVKPTWIWATELATAVMLKAGRLILTIIGTNNRQQLNAKDRPPPHAHEAAPREFPK